MNSTLKSWLQRCVCAVVSLFVVNQASALQVSLTCSTNFYVDFSSDMHCDYVSFMVTNTDGVTYSNLWVTIDSFTNNVLALSSGDIGQYGLGTLANNQGKPAFFYLQSTNDPGNSGATVPSRFAIKIFRGYPSYGTLLSSNNFSLNEVTSGQNQANKVSSLTYSPTNTPVVGGVFKITVVGTTGNVNVGNDMAFTAATFTNWNAGAFQLISCSIVITDTPNYVLTNTLDTASTTHITGNGDGYTAQYWFRAIATTKSNTPVSPVNFLNNGGGTVNHVQEGTLLALSPVPQPTNQTTLGYSTNYTQLYTNETVTFTLHVTNSSTIDVILDRFVDTMPTGYTYVVGSSTFGGASILDPTNISQVLTWSQTYVATAGSVSDLVFRAIPTIPGYGTNTCVAYVQTSQIDTTLDTSDNAPATEVSRALIEPIAANVSTNVLENQTLTVAAPGVLANTVEPNGFSATVVSNSQPAHGTVTVNGNGSYTYTPTAFYWGADSFTFTITNQTLRASTATNSITVNWVNQPPYYTAGANQTNNENAGAQTTSWATGISQGTNDPAQTLTFHVSNSNSNLFSVQPAISSSGTLTYTPAPFAYGSATVTVYLTDNGGTANSGKDTSATNTFTIAVNWVNQPPYFTSGVNQTNNENSGAQTVNNWATGISQGTNDPVQTLTFHVSNDNNSLFSVQPSISSSGTLTYTPATNVFGTANVSVYLTDNAGGTSSTQTFAIVINFVNQPPTLNVISNLTILENWNLQTVSLAGITPGPASESAQTVTITATSGNSSLIPNPTVNYTNPATTGSLSFTPTTNSFGNSTITVVVKDNGGTANGGIDSVTNIFNVLVQGITNYWYGGSNLTVNIFDVSTNGASKTNYLGVLSVPATSTNPFTIKIAGPGTNFNSGSNYTWTIATTTRGVINLTTNQFVFDTSGFTNDLAGGYFKAVLGPDGSTVSLVYVGNNPPTASPLVLSRALNTSLKISIPLILTNYTADPDGDPRIFLGIGASTNGAYITTNSAYIWFAPTNNISESFPYYVSDNRTYRPGDTVYVASSMITVIVTNAVGYAQTITGISSGSVSVRFAGIPGHAYDIQRATSVSGPWQIIATTNAPPMGVWTFTDNSPPQPSAFYRTAQH